MKSNYQHIFTPLTVKNMTIKNRIVMMPMGTNYGEQNGEMSFLHINYYKERAKGGTGLIIVENASVDSPQGSNGTTQLRIDHDNYLPRLYKFCEEIHKYGTCIAIQINHAGASAVSARTNMQPVSASDIPSKESGECDLRKCISCNIGCAGNRIGFNRPIRCTVNPAVLEGDVYKNQKVNKNCNVVVIGGGTAGLEAACTAAEVGCNTFLLEKGETLGGLASVISKIPAKKRLADFPNYLIHRAEQLENLYIFTNTEGTPENIRKFHPNLIVSSTGSAPLLPPIRGLHDRIDKEGSKVASILGMINHINDYPEDMTGKKVVVVGGGAVGLDVVEFFAARNAEISIVEMMDQIGRDLDPVTKNDMKDQMKKHHVAQLTKTALQEVKDSSFLVKDAEGERELPFDYGFVCLGMRAQGQLFAELSDAFVSDDVEILNIGDSKRAKRIIDGTLEGRNILNTLTQMGYLR